MVGDNVDQCTVHWTVRCRVSAESWYRTSQVCNWALGQCYLTVLQPEVIFTHCVELSHLSNQRVMGLLGNGKVSYYLSYRKLSHNADKKRIH